MRRTLRSLGAVLLFPVAASAAAADSTSAASPRTFQYDSLSRLVHASAAQADADRARYFQYDAETDWSPPQRPRPPVTSRTTQSITRTQTACSRGRDRGAIGRAPGSG
jgi:hypothetical protein